VVVVGGILRAVGRPRGRPSAGRDLGGRILVGVFFVLVSVRSVALASAADLGRRGAARGAVALPAGVVADVGEVRSAGRQPEDVRQVRSSARPGKASPENSTSCPPRRTIPNEAGAPPPTVS
jgi:hypothetical protein